MRQTLVLEVHAVKMPVGFDRKDAFKTMGRQLANLVHLKRSIVEVKAEKDCLAYALLIGITKVTGYPNYTSYRKGRKIDPFVRQLLETTGVNLDGGAGIRELSQFQEHFKEYTIVVCAGLLFILCLSKHAPLRKCLLQSSHGYRTPPSSGAHGGMDVQSQDECSRVASRLQPLLHAGHTYCFAMAPVRIVIT